MNDKEKNASWTITGIEFAQNKFFFFRIMMAKKQETSYHLINYIKNGTPFYVTKVSNYRFKVKPILQNLCIN